MGQIQPVSLYAIFPSTVMEFQLDGYRDLNPLLQRVIEKARQEKPGVIRTNQGGWHSEKHLHKNVDTGVQNLLSQIRKSLSAWAMSTFDLDTEPDADKWETELWANINNKGDSNRAHDHFRSGIIASGCYYLQTSDGEGEGRIVFVNQQSIPKFVESDVLPRQQHFALKPTTGQYLIFPSWLGHLVEPHSEEKERISLAFNAGHPDLMVTRKGDRLVRRRFKDLLKKMRRKRVGEKG